MLVYFGVGMYFGKTMCFQIGVLHWCSNIGYIWQVYFWHQNVLGSDMDEMICMIWSLILWIFFVWKVYFRPWWIEDESGRDSGQKRKVSFGVSQGVTTPCIYLASFVLPDWFVLILRELKLIGLISSLLSNLSLYGMVIFGIYRRFRLIFFWEFLHGCSWGCYSHTGWDTLSGC